MKSSINLRHTPLFLALSLISGVSMAQTTQQTTEGLVEEVVVTDKFAQSLQSAMEVKRNSATVVEAISA